MITSQAPSLVINKIKRIDILTAYTLLAASALVVASMTLVAAALADTVWKSRAVSELVGWSGICIWALSSVCLAHAGAMCARRDVKEAQNSIPSDGFPKQDSVPEKSAIEDHPMRDRLLDG